MMSVLSKLNLRFIEHVKRRGSYKEWVRKIESFPSWKPSDFEDYRSRKLKEVGRLAARARFYRERYDVDFLEDLKMESIDKIGFISKGDVIDNGSDIRISGFKGLHRRAYTGGTSGRPVTLYQALSALQAEQAFFDQMWSCAGFRPGSRLLVLRGGLAGRDPIVTSNRMLLPTSFVSDDKIECALRHIAKFDPEYLHSYPSLAVKLANAVKSSSLSHRVAFRGVFCGSEAIYDHQIEFLKNAFGCDVLTWYGHSEQGALATRDLEGSYTFHPLYGHVELLRNADGLDEIVTTGWLNSAMPLLRYRTGDFVGDHEWLTARPVPVLRVDRILGREQEMFVTSRGELVPFNHFVFGLHGSAWAGVDDFLFVQQKAGEMELRIKLVSEGSSAGSAARLEGEFQKRFGDLARIKVVLTDRITGDGKKKTYFQKMAN